MSPKGKIKNKNFQLIDSLEQETTKQPDSKHFKLQRLYGLFFHRKISFMIQCREGFPKTINQKHK